MSATGEAITHVDHAAIVRWLNVFSSCCTVKTPFCIDLSRDQLISLEGVSHLVGRKIDCLRARNDHAACKEVKAHF